MTEDTKKEKKTEAKIQEENKQPAEWEQYLKKFLAVVPPVDPVTLGTAEQTLKYLSDAAQKVPGQIESAFKSLIELLQQVTNIKGIDVQLKSLRQLDIKMHIMKQVDLPLNKDIIGIGKIESLRLSELIHVQAEIVEGKNELKMQIYEGMSIVVKVIFVGGKQVIPLKGAAKLIRDPKGQFLVETTSYVPGTEMPVTVTFPLKQIFDEVRKSGIGF